MRSLRKIFVFLICLLIASSAFAVEQKIKPKKTPLIKLAKQLGNGELLKIPSYQTTSFKGIKEGWYKESPIEVEALLTFPPGDGPFPMLLLVHSSGGPEEFTKDWLEFQRDQQKPLLGMGIGTMYLDNFSARGVKHTYRDQSQASLWATYIDMFMALELLANHPKVNKKKIGVSGYSRGGNLSYLAGEKKLRDVLVSKDLYFAAAQPRSPECWVTGMFANPTPIKETKMWLVLGGADDYTLPGPCVELGKKYKANGGDIKIDVREGWHHLFTGNYEVEFAGRTQFFHDCPQILSDDNGDFTEEFVQGFLVKYGEFESREHWIQMSREDPRGAFKKFFTTA